MSTALFTSPTTIGELRDLLNTLDLTADTRRYALAIAWAFPDLFMTFVRKRWLHPFDGWCKPESVAHVSDLINAGVLLTNKNKTAVTFRQKAEKCQPERCVYCGRHSRKPTKDHVLPKSRGGANSAGNIVFACYACNNAKADRTPEEWARDILDYRKVPKARKPLTRLPWPYRLRLALAACVAFFAGVVR